MSLSELPNTVLEVILSYGQISDLYQFGRTTTRYQDIVRYCIKKGYMDMTPIYMCKKCKKYMVVPVLACFAINRERKETTLLLCSHKCKKELFLNLPRCYLCLTVVYYTKKLERTLICGKCVPNVGHDCQRFI